MTAPPQVNGTKRPALPVVWDWRPAGQPEPPMQEQTEVPPTPEPQPQPAAPAVDHVAIAEAEAIRARAAAEAEAARIKAEADAEALRIEAEGKAAALAAKAEAEAEKQRLANVRAEMKLEADKATHEKRVAQLKAEAAAAAAAEEKTQKDAAADANRDADRDAEQQRTESLWKWGARGIYAVGLVIAAPVQFMHFWDPARKFLVAAPLLLEGLALVLALGAAWAVAHRRDVAPFRVGIMLGAVIAAAINLYGGMTDEAIGFNAGLIGAIASLGGPIVLMTYEHGIAQKVDGIPSRRERRATKKAKSAEEAARAKAKADKKATEDKAAAEKAEQQARATAEQKRRDEDRKAGHEAVWNVADAMRSARGSEFVTEQIWADAWYRVTGSKHVGITAAIEAQSRLAQAEMKAAAEYPIDDSESQVGSQTTTRPKKDPDALDKRRFNGGIPPLRTPGDTRPYSEAARKAASLAARQNVTTEEQK